jgi:hypothetical protein
MAKKKTSCSCPNDYWYYANKIGLLFILLFAVCFFWSYFRPINPGLHLELMQLKFFGFTGVNFSSFVAGLVQSYLWGYIVIIFWKIICLSCGREAKK